MSAQTHEVAGYRVVLTNFGCGVTVVDSTEHIDEDAIRLLIAETTTDAVWSITSSVRDRQEGVPSYRGALIPARL